MEAADFLRMQLEECFGQVYRDMAGEAAERVSRVRFVGRDAERRARGPSILWWAAIQERNPLLDGVAPPSGIGFRIECRAESMESPDPIEPNRKIGAAPLLECVLERLGPHVIAIEDQYDEDDSASRQRLDYVAAIASVTLPEIIEVSGA